MVRFSVNLKGILPLSLVSFFHFGKKTILPLLSPFGSLVLLSYPACQALRRANRRYVGLDGPCISISTRLWVLSVADATKFLRGGRVVSKPQ